MYLDYNKLNTNTHVEFIILNIFSNCGLIRLVNRVLNAQFNEKDKEYSEITHIGPAKEVFQGSFQI